MLKNDVKKKRFCEKTQVPSFHLKMQATVQLTGTPNRSSGKLCNLECNLVIFVTCMKPLALKTPPTESPRSGAAVIEFAVVLPVFVLIVLGTIETCNMIFLQQSLKIAAYEAARVTLIPTADDNDVTVAVDDILTSRRVNSYSVTVSPANFSAAVYGTFIRVDVSSPCASNTVFPLRFYGSKTLTGRVEMMKE